MAEPLRAGCDVRLGPPSSSPHQPWPNLRIRVNARGSEPCDREIWLTGFATRGKHVTTEPPTADNYRGAHRQRSTGANVKPAIAAGAAPMSSQGFRCPILWAWKPKGTVARRVGGGGGGGRV
ncbi:hypothetical protein S40293_11112 [Stachybotrys chartarum IBT 40293]|nr:hypothetical protein S40293_11112 [Stachybotrys chartarum IBT 40293]